MDKKFDDLFKYIDNITETNKVKKKKSCDSDVYINISFFYNNIKV